MADDPIVCGATHTQPVAGLLLGLALVPALVPVLGGELTAVVFALPAQSAVVYAVVPSHRVVVRARVVVARKFDLNFMRASFNREGLCGRTEKHFTGHAYCEREGCGRR